MNKETLEKANNFPLPHPPPASALPGHVPRWRSDRARSDARCPPPRPRGAWKTKQRSSRDRSRAPGCAPLRSAPPAARSLITLRSIERSRHTSATLRSARWPSALYLATLGPLNQAREILLTPHPPPARACPFTPFRFRSGRARSDSSLPPAPPAGGEENKTTQLVRSLAGTRLRFDSLRSACSPLAHYAPLDRAQPAHLRYTSFHSVPLGGHLPSISLLWVS